MHYVVPDIFNSFKLFTKRIAINLKTQFDPNYWVLKQTQVLAKCQVRDRFNLSLNISLVFTVFQIDLIKLH